VIVLDTNMIAERNVAVFGGIGIDLINPWPVG
jgi:hypothetical protein